MDEDTETYKRIERFGLVDAVDTQIRATQAREGARDLDARVVNTRPQQTDQSASKGMNRNNAAEVRNMASL